MTLNVELNSKKFLISQMQYDKHVYKKYKD